MIIGLSTFLFVFLSLILALFIYIQQGRGDMGLGSLGTGSQTLFGGSGGLDFFKKATWTMGLLFMIGSLILAILKSNDSGSRIKHYQANMKTNTQQEEPVKNNLPIENE